MAEKGGVRGESSILKTHPNGGGLRTMLGQNNYVVHEAAYGSKIGEGTDVCHWNRKFRDHMERILSTRYQDTLHNDGARNRVVMFQAGDAGNLIVADGQEPGNPDSSEKTVANYKAAYLSLLEYFRQEPQTLFIPVTAPPVVKPDLPQGIIRRILGRPCRDQADEMGKSARAFNNWLKNIHSGWLKNYPLRNVVVFDYYNILTCCGASNWLRYPSGNAKDSLPNTEGNANAAQEFIPFINRSMNRMGKQVSNFYVSGQEACAF